MLTDAYFSVYHSVMIIKFLFTSFYYQHLPTAKNKVRESYSLEEAEPQNYTFLNWVIWALLFPHDRLHNQKSRYTNKNSSGNRVIYFKVLLTPERPNGRPIKLSAKCQNFSGAIADVQMFLRLY